MLVSVQYLGVMCSSVSCGFAFFGNHPVVPFYDILFEEQKKIFNDFLRWRIYFERSFLFRCAVILFQISFKQKYWEGYVKLLLPWKI